MRLVDTIIRKHKDRVLDVLNEGLNTEADVDAHTRHSNKGKVFSVRRHSRKLSWSGDAKKGQTMTAIHPEGSFTISMRAGRAVLRRKGIEIGEPFSSVKAAKRQAEIMTGNKNA